jgi:hypothetical protein
MASLLRSSGFLVALLTATAASLVAVVATRRAMRSMALAFAAIVAAAAGLAAEDVLPGALLPALLLVAGGAFVSEGRPLVVRVAALAPGVALLVALATNGTDAWARILVFLTVLGVGPATAVLDRRVPSLSFALLVISALGIYATVPDTEQARSLVGALVPVALVVLVWARVPEPSGPILGVALLAWVALLGGVARHGAVIGGIGCLGVLALAPVARRSRPVALVAVHVGVVAIASRVAGLQQSAWTAIAILVPVMVIAAVILMTGERRRTRNPP